MTHRIGIIGLGIMGRRMLANMRLHPQFEPVAMWDPSGVACDAAKDEAPEVAVAANADEVIVATDAVYLACPPVPRKTYALAAAAAGKGVFLEKPLGIDLGESRDLVAGLSSAGVPSAVNFTQAAGKALGETVRAFASGEAGSPAGIDIVVTYSKWPRAWQVEADWLRFRAEGGYVREVISHFVFLSLRLLGPLRVVSASPSYPADASLCETHVLARLENAGGVPVTILGSVGGAQPDRQEVTVKGSSRSYRIAEFFNLSVSDGGSFEQAIEPPADPRLETLQRQLSELDKCMIGEAHILATVEEALAVQEIVEHMLGNS